jgi:hypothetical protein
MVYWLRISLKIITGKYLYFFLSQKPERYNVQAFGFTLFFFNALVNEIFPVT